jgi:hypothetical protein
MKSNFNSKNTNKIQGGEGSLEAGADGDVFSSFCDSFFTLLTVEDTVLDGLKEKDEPRTEHNALGNVELLKNHPTNGSYLNILPVKNNSDYPFIRR